MYVHYLSLRHLFVKCWAFFNLLRIIPPWQCIIMIAYARTIYNLDFYGIFTMGFPRLFLIRILTIIIANHIIWTSSVIKKLLSLAFSSYPISIQTTLYGFFFSFITVIFYYHSSLLTDFLLFGQHSYLKLFLCIQKFRIPRLHRHHGINIITIMAHKQIYYVENMYIF